MSVAVGDGPARRPLAAGDHGDEDQHRHQHAAERRRDRQHRGAPLPELADHELALDLEADDEEEQRHQPVVDPVAQVVLQVEAGDLEADLEVPDVRVGLVGRAVRPHQRHDRRDGEGDAARRLLVEEVRQRVDEPLHARQAMPCPPRRSIGTCPRPPIHAPRDRRPTWAPASGRRARTPASRFAALRGRSASRQVCSRRSSGDSPNRPSPRCGRSSRSSACHWTACSRPRSRPTARRRSCSAPAAAPRSNWRAASSGSASPPRRTGTPTSPS